MPRRLLAVGSSGRENEPFLFSPVETAPYASLSYCWGSDSSGVLKTTSKNIESHRRAIPSSLLPATIQDALVVCRGLKIAYLWVDSLCIVQDDKDDWLRESAQMRDIYSNSLLTIAAEEPASSRLGFLGKQRFGAPDWQQPLGREASGKELYLRPRAPESYLRRTRCSLDKRGWCLQERILPRRRLCFNGDEMTWECLCRRLCECGHTLWAPEPSSFGMPRVAARPPSSVPGRDWRALVEEYSKRSLTHQTDKLNAISGLAKMVACVRKDANGVVDTYLAGMWKSEFISDLTWRVVSAAKDSGNEAYRAPSWSWASINGAVQYEFDDVLSTWKYPPSQVPACAVDEACCENVLRSDPTGLITGGHAILTGPVASVELAILDEGLSASLEAREIQGTAAPFSSTRSLARAANLLSLEVFLDRLQDVNLTSQDTGSTCWVEGRCGCQSCHFGVSSQWGGPSEPFYCLKLFTWAATGGMDDSDRARTMPPEVWFLVLRKMSATETAFERIGLGVWKARFDKRTKERNAECPLFQGCGSFTVKIV